MYDHELAHIDGAEAQVRDSIVAAFSKLNRIADAHEYIQQQQSDFKAQMMEHRKNGLLRLAHKGRENAIKALANEFGINVTIEAEPAACDMEKKMTNAKEIALAYQRLTAAEAASATLLTSYKTARGAALPEEIAAMFRALDNALNEHTSELRAAASAVLVADA
ncbi:hypothetical protein CYR55_22570 [Chimaeribacter californicus]|uniref:Uncharacterized protein n=2 Tax=Chimaeribacter californicus TaxID=2060067 RepID=A0A2N5DTK8_9GAMM|nr:hypothetical protein CYR55_22570 [Chimaeribacter californicus]